MPKKTFYNLQEDKRNAISEAIKREFREKPLNQASVSSIVKELGIARGSFYQYFDSLEEAFYMTLQEESVDIHRKLQEIIAGGEDFFKALEEFGDFLGDHIFRDETFNLYRNRYLYWTYELNEGWMEYGRNVDELLDPDSDDLYRLTEKWNLSIGAEEMPEVIEYIKALIHDLVRRIYINGWDREKFLEKYRRTVQYIRCGLEKRE